MTLVTLLAFAAEGAEHHENVQLQTLWYGIVAIVVFASLAFVTLSYRNVANRHSAKADAYAKAHANDVQHTGHGHGH